MNGEVVRASFDRKAAPSSLSEEEQGILRAFQETEEEMLAQVTLDMDELDRSDASDEAKALGRKKLADKHNEDLKLLELARDTALAVEAEKRKQQDKGAV